MAVLVVEEARVPGENHRSWASNWCKVYHLRLRVKCTLFCDLQSRARTHVVLVICSYEPPGPLNINTIYTYIDRNDISDVAPSYKLILFQFFCKTYCESCSYFRLFSTLVIVLIEPDCLLSR
jgi:hypothetical protein